MKVIQISDCHLFADKNKLGYNHINPYNSLARILIEVIAHKPDYLLVTGDISGDHSKASYQHFKQLLAAANIQCPYSIIPGNHDLPELLVTQFPAQCLWHNSPLNLGTSQWQLHLMSSHYQGALGYVAEGDLNRLAAHLTDNPDKYHLLAVHHHPVSCGFWMDKHEWLNRAEFINLIEQFPKVKAVVYGHIHNDLETNKKGVKYLACPATCWQWAAEPSFAVSELSSGFRVINLSENGQVNTSVQRLASV
ncbi:metallophosphoesterase [Paraglaciecola aquimarina]|uniref:Metallophosphoesterase n=1 Tax=Paraglaciecola aquimarina TaxID=1235557 RepID=A0ABU3SUB8_9ALTE|nr:metallophosphoesterase [Paraglaciecola aquimarina]MDU0353572.1 metallophosphoesterase [Paraglaciecola aquimarina]